MADDSSSGSATTNDENARPPLDAFLHTFNPLDLLGYTAEVRLFTPLIPRIHITDLDDMLRRAHHVERMLRQATTPLPYTVREAIAVRNHLQRQDYDSQALIEWLCISPVNVNIALWDLRDHITGDWRTVDDPALVRQRDLGLVRIYQLICWNERLPRVPVQAPDVRTPISHAMPAANGEVEELDQVADQNGQHYGTPNSEMMFEMEEVD